MNDDRRRRQVEEDDSGKPENDVRRTLFGSYADPGKADDEEDLREREIDEAEILGEVRATSFDRRFVRESRHSRKMESA